ncbi:MAG: hypothetical protein Kow0092_22530 [Deferrisomatales bacterium]
MVRTTVGYTGGHSPSPTYRDLGDHTEAVQVEYDPSRIAYEELLAVFWAAHDPASRAWSRQYEHAAFYHAAAQRRLLLASRERVEQRTRRTVRTRIAPAGPFYPAEAYHQKYYLRHSGRLWDELRACYPEDGALAASTAAARINGYLAGFGSPEALARDLPRLGLSPAGRAALEHLADLRRR